MSQTSINICCPNLHDASFNGHQHCIKRLLQPKINSVDTLGYTPLHYACWGGQAEVIDVLLQNNAKINAQNIAGCTPLHSAVANGHACCVKELLGRGADPSIVDEDGTTPLDLAKIIDATGRIEKSAECIKLLQNSDECLRDKIINKRRRNGDNKDHINKKQKK